MLPGIAAHCDPDFCGDLACSAPPPEMQMSNRTAKFVSAIFASLLAGVPLTTISHSALPAADECLSAPKKAETPPGGHWYYRVDRATKRHCWFVAEERGKPARARPNSSPAAKPASPVAETAMQGSIADAHAELTAQSVIEPPNRDGALATAMPADVAVREDNRDAKTPGDETNRSIFASRWPQQSTASPSVGPTPNSDDPGTSVNSTEETQPPSLLTASQFAAADISSQASSYSVPKLLATIIGALALAGLAVSVVFRFGRTRRPAPRRVRERRSVNWESANIDRRTPSAYPGTSRRPVARDLDRAGDPNDRIERFFVQLRAPT
jgi:hypothetical protein